MNSNSENNMGEIIPGIYLEVKKTQIGTGSTSRSTSFRNFWMTDFQEDGNVKITLLNDEFMLTGLNENITADELASDRFTYVPEGEKRYQALLEVLKRKDSTPKTGAVPKNQKKTNKREAQESPDTRAALGFLGLGKPEEGGMPGNTSKQSLSRKKPKKPTDSGKKGWWNT